MYAVGKLGSYISRGVVTVAAPFHPFGGAVDIVVVEQEDGSFKSSPWYIQFGKFQGVLKAKEKVVTLNINGVDADFRMYLDNKGGAYFVREVDMEDGISDTASSGDDSQGISGISRPNKSVSCNYDAQESKLVSQSEAGATNVVARYSSTGPRILGYVFGRRSEKENTSPQQEAAIGRDTEASLERAEIAADLLEVRWSTSLATRKQKRENASCNSDQHSSINGEGKTLSRLDNDSGSKPDSSMLLHSNGSIDSSSHSDCINDAGDAGINQNDEGAYRSESVGSTSFVGILEELKSDAAGALSSGDEHSTIFQVLQAEDGSRIEIFQPSIDCETSGSFVEEVDSSNGVSGTIDDPLEELHKPRKLTSELNPEYSTTVLPCQMNTNTEKLEDKNPCISVDGSNSGAVTSDDIETVLQTKLEVILGCKTNEGPVKLVDELVVDQIAPKQATNLTSSLLIEEATTAALHLMEDLRSEEHCSYSPSDSLVTNGAVLDDSEDEQFISSDLESSGPPMVLTVGGTSPNIIRNECNSHDCGEGDNKVCGLPEELNDAQTFFSDLDGSETPRSLDTDATPFDSLKPESNSQSYPDSSKDKFDGSSEMLNKSHSYMGELIQDTLPNDDSSCPEISRTTSSPISIVGAHEQADQVANTVDSFSSSWSHGVEKNSQDNNNAMSVSLDSSFASMMNVPGEQLPTPKKSSLEQYKVSEELKELLSDPAVGKTEPESSQFILVPLNYFLTQHLLNAMYYVEISICRHLLYEGMGYEAAAHAFDSEELDLEKLVSLGPDFHKNDKIIVRIGGLYFPWTAALPIISAIGSPRDEEILEPKGMINVEEVEYAVERSPQQVMESDNGTWRLWPFKKAKSMNKRNSVVLDATRGHRGSAGNSDTSESGTIKKKFVRAKTPTSEQLSSLNLKEGKNTVTFTFSTSMLGEQKVDARIYLWKWNDRIVISDVDGTITKSDVLGQFMPMVGYDWSQTGVTHLFSAIKENGYKLLFLSARAISQASVTRQFLFNLKQDGKALPEGPVVISPDGLFPSLFREVIRRAPHEFKIACLEDIKALFPPDSNPFYAGFGNRDTDIVSYVKVGIPKGKVFIINPKGEVAVHRCVATKSYTSLHELVHEMFPESSAASLSEKA
ncbi:hypothetical protein V2J09_007537 [Rumex salicifolius]